MTKQEEENEMTPFEEATIEIERQKLALESRRIDVEKGKRRETLFAVSTPIMVAILTVAFGIWTGEQQANRDYQATIFKAVSEEGDAYDAIDKLKFLAQVFPGGFPATIPEYPAPQDAWGESQNAKSRDLFFEQMRQAGATRTQLLALWRSLFPTDQWVKDRDLDKIISPIQVRK
jgi:hypothetical protein